jgi:hypothetical protein
MHHAHLDSPSSLAAANRPSPPRIEVGGDNFGSAVVIPGLPFSDTGNTCAFANDVEAPIECAFSPAADIFYTYTATTDQCVRISLCNSQYNTVLEVYDSAHELVACNDNYFALNFECELRSILPSVKLIAGEQYYFVVDGFGGDCGSYQIDVSACPPPCATECPAGAIVENEPACGPETPPENVQCLTPVHLACNDLGVVWCGTFGHYVSPIDSSETRDVDNFLFTLDVPSTVTACVCGPQFADVEIATVDPVCPRTSLCYSQGGEGEEICCTVNLPAGTYGLSVTDLYGSACGTPYVLRVTGMACPPVAALPGSWSRVKTLYR